MDKATAAKAERIEEDLEDVFHNCTRSPCVGCVTSSVDFLFLLQPRRLPGAGLQHGVQRGEPAVRVQGGHAVEQQVGYETPKKSDS